MFFFRTETDCSWNVFARQQVDDVLNRSTPSAYVGSSIQVRKHSCTWFLWYAVCTTAQTSSIVHRLIPFELTLVSIQVKQIYLNIWFGKKAVGQGFFMHTVLKTGQYHHFFLSPNWATNSMSFKWHLVVMRSSIACSHSPWLASFGLIGFVAMHTKFSVSTHSRHIHVWNDHI